MDLPVEARVELEGRLKLNTGIDITSEAYIEWCVNDFVHVMKANGVQFVRGDRYKLSDNLTKALRKAPSPRVQTAIPTVIQVFTEWLAKEKP